MMALVADHLWQSTLWAAAAALAARALASQPAQVRYLLWLTASIKFLVPFAALVWIGQQLGARPLAAPAPAGANATFTFEVFTHPFTASGAAMPPSPVPAVDMLQLLIAVWMCGVLAVLVAWFVRWRRIHAVVLAAAPVHGLTDAVPVVSSPATLEPAVFGIFRPVLLWPASAEGRLSDEEAEAIVAHELCHV